MINKNLYIDIHALQTVPPSCVNRDDAGSPKTAIYGGTTRARVSSQCWKHAMRLMFEEISLDDPAYCGKRTKYITQMIVDEMKKIRGDTDNSHDEEYRKEAATILSEGGLKKKAFKFEDKNNEKLKTLYFISKQQAKAIAELALEKCNDPQQIEKALRDYPSADIALFGRMAANDPSLNYDAAAQVAHSISTHTVHNEYDYFTAVDDLQPDDNNGAGHLGTVEFNSSTLYRYATVNVNELSSHLDDMTPEVVGNFIKAFVLSMPTGKENSFANRTLPDYIYVTARHNQPINLVGAFEKAVTSKNNGYSEASAEALVRYAKKVYKDYASEPDASWALGDKFSEIAEIKTFPQIIELVESYVKDRIAESGAD